MARFRAPHQPVGDLLLAVACVVAMLVELAVSEKAEGGALAVPAIVLGAVPVLVRRQAPGLAFALAMVALFGVMEAAGTFNTMVVPAVACAYALASRHGLRAAVMAGALAIPLVLLILHIYSPHSLLGWDTAKNVGLVALPLALGVAAHDRRAATSALVERAEAAERNRDEETRRRIGEERLRIARDVHDVVAHAMVTINVQAGVGAHLLEGDPERAHTTLRDIKKVSGDALAELRSMLGILRAGDESDSWMAPTRPVQGLADVGELRESLASAGVDLTVEVDPAARSLPASVEATGFRIVQEALTNVIRHAGPTSAALRITHLEDGVVLEVEDDGGGTPPTALSASGSGNGVRGMRERATALGGSLEAGPRDGGGWRVRAHLPTTEVAAR